MALSKTMQDLAIGSDTEKGDVCAACETDGEYRQAVKFCLDCNQPICKSCVDSHRRIKQIQGHKLVDNKNQEAVKVAQILSSVLTCPKHPDKNIELMCVDHDALCCSRCVTVNHRSCRQVKELSTDNAVANTQGVSKRIKDAKTFMSTIVKQYQNNNKDIQSHIGSIIPKQIQEMRASINQTLDRLENVLMSEAKVLGEEKIEKGNTEIARWQSHIKTVTEGAALFTVAQQNGSDIHKCITAKTALETLNEIDMKICQQGSTVNLEKVSFSFDKNALLENTFVSINNKKISLAEIDQRKKQQVLDPRSGQFEMNPSRGYYGYLPTNSFATVSVEREAFQLPQYNPRKTAQRGLWGGFQ